MQYKNNIFFTVKKYSNNEYKTIFSYFTLVRSTIILFKNIDKTFIRKECYGLWLYIYIYKKYLHDILKFSALFGSHYYSISILNIHHIYLVLNFTDDNYYNRPI